MLYILEHIWYSIGTMSENQVIPPVPESRVDRYKWIDHVVSLGLSVAKACRIAEIPRTSYYQLYLPKKGRGNSDESRGTQPEGQATDEGTLSADQDSGQEGS